MKKALYAVAAAAAAVAMAPQAQAAEFLNVQGLTAGAFDISLSLAIGAGPVDISVISLGTANVDFTSVTFGSQALDITNDIFGNVDTAVLLPPVLFAAGTYTLRIIGTSAANGAFTAVLNVTPVPEPATWAMMVAGIAAVGTAMRRRNQSVRVSFS